MERIQAALRRTASVAPTHARMEAPAGKHLVPTSAPATWDGVARTALKVCLHSLLTGSLEVKHFIIF